MTATTAAPMGERPNGVESRWLTGDPAAFRALVSKHGGLVVTLADRYARDVDELEDLTQEIWLQVYRKRHTYEERGSLLAWILAVGRNVCVSHRRGADRHEKALDRLAASSPPEQRTAEPVEVDIDTERMAAIAMDALAKLPYRQREAITCRLIEGLDSDEAARRMNCKKGTIRSLLRNGLIGIRKQLEERHGPVS